MKAAKIITRVLTILLLAGVVALFIGQVTGQPLLLSYVKTGSMAPTLNAGDGFIALPTAVAGPIGEGDVISFRSEELRGGDGLVTHRVVRVTDQGYVTKGDANNAVDQKTGEPLIKEAQVVAVALQVDGHLVAIPHFGTAVTGAQTALESVNFVLERLFGIGARVTMERLPYVFFILSLIAYTVGTWRERNSTDRERKRSRGTGTDVRLIIAVMAGIIVISATGAMILPSGSQQYELIASPTDSPRLVPLGEETNRTHSVVNPGRVPVVVFLEPGSTGVEIQPQEIRLNSGELSNATATFHAPEETGYYRYYVVEHRYLALLPQSTIGTLYQIHPWAPILAIDALLGVPFYLLGVSLVGTGRIRSRSRDKPSRWRRLLSRFI